MDIYSGQPNPRWKLDKKVFQDMLEEISHLATENKLIPRPNQLGYRGLRVVMVGEHEEIYICGGYVFLCYKGLETIFIDGGQQIERKLLKSGIGMSDQLSALISQILQSLDDARLPAKSNS
ncbi:MAG: hypothetical protein ACXV7J_02050 [Methylomonas sp.]